QRDAGHGAADGGDLGVDLVAGDLAAFAGLGALRHLDLELRGGDEIGGRDAEAARGDLLDLAVGDVTDARVPGRVAARRAVGVVGVEARLVLAALARVAAGAEAVHGDGQELVRLARERAVAHGLGTEAPGDLLGRLDLIERRGLGGRDPLEEVAQGARRA